MKPYVEQLKSSNFPNNPLNRTLPKVFIITNTKILKKSFKISWVKNGHSPQLCFLEMN